MVSRPAEAWDGKEKPGVGSRLSREQKWVVWGQKRAELTFHPCLGRLYPATQAPSPASLPPFSASSPHILLFGHGTHPSDPEDKQTTLTIFASTPPSTSTSIPTLCICISRGFYPPLYEPCLRAKGHRKPVSAQMDLFFIFWLFFVLFTFGTGYTPNISKAHLDEMGFLL